tara:strand:+ start:183 stop:434 length:252 start_codon:yes stop_codon:yes gene_type:complete
MSIIVALLSVASVGCGVAVVHADDRAGAHEKRVILPAINQADKPLQSDVTILELPHKTCDFKERSFEEALKQCVQTTPSRFRL